VQRCFSDEIVAVSTVCCLVSIVSSAISIRNGARASPRILSDALQTGGLVIATKSRVFKSSRRPVDTQEPPAPMKELLGYEFFLSQDGAARFDPAYGQEYARSTPNVANGVAGCATASTGGRRERRATAMARMPAVSRSFSSKPAGVPPECSYDRSRKGVIDGELKRLGYSGPSG